MWLMVLADVRGGFRRAQGEICGTRSAWGASFLPAGEEGEEGWQPVDIRAY